jgi:hypothetical protein
MNDPDGQAKLIKQLCEYVDDLELRLKLRDKRIMFWQGMASDLYDELIGFYKPANDPFGSLTSTINRFEEAERYGSE